jgi:predicted MFS family arabinose efflux permease
VQLAYLNSYFESDLKSPLDDAILQHSEVDVSGWKKIVGITDGLSMPSFQSIVPSIVEKKQIPTGIALNSTQFNLSRILGPAIAGVLMGSVGAVGTFGVSALSYVPFILVALWVLPNGVAGTVAHPHAPGFTWARLQANVREILAQPALRGALTIVFISGLLCAPLVVFCPVLVQQAMHGDVGHFSLTVGAFGVGGLLGAISLLGLDAQRNCRPITLAFGWVYDLVVIAASQAASV